jgi:hypothetical protein
MSISVDKAKELVAQLVHKVEHEAADGEATAGVKQLMNEPPMRRFAKSH